MQYPQFIDNKTFYQLDKSKSEQQQLLAIAENLKKIHMLTTRSYDSFEEMIQHYLEAGVEIFQMETGIVSHITDDKVYIVKDVVTPLEVIHSGDEYALEDTYCREVYKSQCTIGLPCVGSITEMRGHPVYQNLKLEAYISAPIFVRDTLYGTFNFTSITPREHGFSEHEMDLIAMMANSIGNFIHLQEKEQTLLTLNNRLKELAGFVAHDLRNPLAVISNLAQLVAHMELSPEQKVKFISDIQRNADRSLELVQSVLEVAALGTGKLTLKIAPFALSKVIDESLENYNIPIIEKSLNVQNSLPDDLLINGDEARVLQVINNLLGNAIKYSPQGGRIMISEKANDGKMSIIEISNKIAAKNDPGRQFTGKTRSIGFGLEIAREIIGCHNGELRTRQNDQHFTSQLSLPVR